MKMNKVVIGLLVFGLMVSFMTAVPVSAQDGTPPKLIPEGETMDGMTGVHTPQIILGLIEQRHQILTRIVVEKKLDEVHKQAFAIRDLAKELSGVVAPEKKMKVTATASNISKLADELDESGDAGNQVATEANLKKMDGLIMMLMSQAS